MYIGLFQNNLVAGESSYIAILVINSSNMKIQNPKTIT